jgi:hypothetical protein
MAINITPIATELFAKLKSRASKLSISGRDNKVTSNIDDARYFEFDYTDSNKNNFGSVIVSIGKENELSVTYGQNITTNMDEDQRREWNKFLKSLKFFAQRKLLSFKPNDITKDRLTKDDVNIKASNESPKSLADTNVTESKFYGSKKKSYLDIAEGTRLAIIHSTIVDENQRGSRSRHIHNIFVENTDGERFKVPNNLRVAKALGRNIAEGGKIYDEFSTHIMEMGTELSALSTFLRQGHKLLEDEEALEITNVVQERRTYLRKVLESLRGSRGFKKYKESYQPTDSMLSEDGLDTIKSKFARTSFPRGIDDALPYIQRAVNMKNRPVVEQQLSEFEQYMNEIVDSGLDLDSEDSEFSQNSSVDIEKLQTMMKDVCTAGIDGMDALSALKDALGDAFDNILASDIHSAAVGSPDTDIRPIVYDWLETNLPNVFDKVKADMETGAEPEDDESDDIEIPGEEPPVDDDTTEEPTDQESGAESTVTQPKPEDSLSEMRRLAGI